MPAGRPTNYNDEILAKAKEYLTVWNVGEDPDVIPTVEGLSLFLGIARSTIYLWAKDKGFKDADTGIYHPQKQEFIDTLTDLEIKQKKILMNKGLTGDFNSNITKLVLGTHGISEKIHNEMSAPGGGPIQTTTAINFIPVSRGKGKDE